MNKLLGNFILKIRVAGVKEIEKREKEEAERKRLAEEAELERQILLE